MNAMVFQQQNMSNMAGEACSLHVLFYVVSCLITVFQEYAALHKYSNFCALNGQQHINITIQDSCLYSENYATTNELVSNITQMEAEEEESITQRGRADQIQLLFNWSISVCMFTSSRNIDITAVCAHKFYDSHLLA